MGRDVAEVLTLSDPAPIGVVREWGVRQLGLELELTTSAAIRKPVTVDLFPAYDEDGGLAGGADAAHARSRVRCQAQPGSGAPADEPGRARSEAFQHAVECSL